MGFTVRGSVDTRPAHCALFIDGHAPYAMVERPADIVVLGGTPGGICAGVAAAEAGCAVEVIARRDHVGGLPANGLGATDSKTRGATGGLFSAFVDRITAKYRETDGLDSYQAWACSEGYHSEPDVGEETV